MWLSSNAAPYLDACLGSVLAQTHRPLQLSVYDDGSNDESPAIIARWVPVLEEKGISVVAGYNTTQTVKAVTKFNPGKAIIIHLMISICNSSYSTPRTRPWCCSE